MPFEPEQNSEERTDSTASAKNGSDGESGETSPLIEFVLDEGNQSKQTAQSKDANQSDQDENTIVIPTQYPNGFTDPNDRTSYSKESATARSYIDMSDSVVRVIGDKTVDGKTVSPSGSGFFVSDDGRIATDYHNLKGLTNLRIVMEGGESHDAEIVGVDRRTDLAVIRALDAQKAKFSKLELGSSAALSRGDQVSAWGYPFGVERLFNSPGGTPQLPGGFQRRVPLSTAMESAGYGSDEIPGLLMKGERRDRSILDSYILVNSGNSGGPLLDATNKVVGVIGLSDRTASAIATPVEDLQVLLSNIEAEAKEAKAKNQSPRVFLDGLDISEDASREQSQIRTESRAAGLEKYLNFQSITGRALPEALPESAPQFGTSRRLLPGQRALMDAGRLENGRVLPRLKLEKDQP